jgi:Uncharacterised protein family (UPF0104).
VQVATYALGVLAVGLRVPLAAVVVAVVSVNVGGVLRSTPGNVGVFQLMFAVALVPFGISNESAVAAAVLIQSVQMMSAILAAFVASLLMDYRRGRRARREKNGVLISFVGR